MPHSPKRITRKDLRQPDQFVTLTGKLIHLVQQHKTASIASLAVILGAFLLWGSWDLYRGRQNRLAAQGYSRALSLFQEGRYREATEVFTQVSKSGSSTYSRVASLYLANIYLAQDQPQKALPVLQELARKKIGPEYLQQLALLTLGYAEEKTAKYKEASTNFAAAARLSGPFRGDAMLGNARANRSAGQDKEALSIYRDYLTSFAGAERSAEISLQVDELEAKIGKAEKAK